MIQIVHIHLAPANTILMLGSMFKDTSRINFSLLDKRMLEGLELNENISSFIQQHPAYERSKRRLNYRFKKHADKILFIFFDHFLTANWKNYSEQSLEAFSEQTCAYLLENTQLLPYSVKKNMKSLIDANWIVNMASIRGVHEYMQLITIKDTFQSILEYSLEDLVNNYHDFKGDFEEIMPDLTKFIKNTTNIRKNRILEEVAYVK